MKIRTFFSAILISIFLIAAVSAASTNVENLAERVVSDNVPDATAAVNELRSMGAVGLDALFAKYASEIAQFKDSGTPDENWAKIAKALDAVAMQKDAYTSHLYWYTDLEEAKRVAAAKNKPILTLRLLGNLNEEFSCANSRLFRAVLYPNAEISKYLRENYVLHWQSVRPAPRITIDFGDGRKIERTITGNSIHYIINADGTIIDALPGLYSPKSFLGYLQEANAVNTSLQNVAAAKRSLAVMKYRKAAFDRIVQQRNLYLKTAGVEPKEPNPGIRAIEAAPLAMVKAMVTDEYTLLRVYDDFAKFDPSVNLDDWNKLAKFYSANSNIDTESVSFIRRQNAKTGLSEADFTALFTKLNNYIALDTTRNDFMFHTKIYQWLNQNRTDGGLDNLNRQVYDQLFKTPDYDKWLGLYTPDVYTALDGNGIIK